MATLMVSMGASCARRGAAPLLVGVATTAAGLAIAASASPESSCTSGFACFDLGPLIGAGAQLAVGLTIMAVGATVTAVGAVEVERGRREDEELAALRRRYGASLIVDGEHGAAAQAASPALAGAELAAQAALAARVGQCSAAAAIARRLAARDPAQAAELRAREPAVAQCLRAAP